MGRAVAANSKQEADEIKQIVIVDNGAYSLKVGLDTDTSPRIIPNCVSKVKSERRRPFIGDQMDECKDYSGIFYILPFNRGYLVNWDVQRQIWNYVFRTKLNLPYDSHYRYSSIGLIITEPVFNFAPIRKTMIEMLFEEYGFGMILVTSAPQMAALRYFYDENRKDGGKTPTAKKEVTCLVVDSGYSFSHVVPFVEGHKIEHHMKRVDVGGKALTNHLKDIISYRQINVMDETYVVNQIKEDCCFVSVDFWRDLEVCRQPAAQNTIVRDYVLPDYTVYKRGFVYDREKHRDLNRSDYQLIRMNNERFQVPEMLFHPADVHLDQIGLSQTIIYAVGEFNQHYVPPTVQLDADAAPVSRERPENLKEIDSEDEDDYLDYYETPEAEGGGGGDQSSRSASKRKQNGNGGLSETDDQSEQPVDYSKYDNEDIQAQLYDNILLIGGNCCFPNFRDRMFSEVRSTVPFDLLNVRVNLPDNPITYAWQGARMLCGITPTGDPTTDLRQSLFHRLAVSRKDFKRKGLEYCHRRLSSYPIPTFAPKST